MLAAHAGLQAACLPAAQSWNQSPNMKMLKTIQRGQEAGIKMGGGIDMTRKVNMVKEDMQRDSISSQGKKMVQNINSCDYDSRADSDTIQSKKSCSCP